MNVGIIGRGFVGSAVEYGFSPQTGCDGSNIKIYDKDSSKSQNSLKEVVTKSDFIFLSVPTPSNLDGSCNLDIVYSVMQDINNLTDINIPKSKRPIILLRSTVVPGTTRKIQKHFPALNIVFNPEFLTERSAKFDFINQSRYVIGGSKKNVSKVALLYQWRFGNTGAYIETNFETAEMIKYMNNCFFATKVSFLNEMKLIAERTNVDWETAVDGFVADGRIGHSHLAVPGPDGKRGFGGSCFPKDIQAMIQLGKELGIDTSTLKGAWKTNINVRPEKDWETLKGRAIVED
tara:strand:+ start:3729 stop:4598 length:870 start_codon:yes stop_codon:yes gene_type:complete